MPPSWRSATDLTVVIGASDAGQCDRRRLVVVAVTLVAIERRLGPAGLLDEELFAIEPGVQAAESEQLGVRARLGDPATLVDHDPVGAKDRRQAVGDGDGRSAFHQALEG